MPKIPKTTSTNGRQQQAPRSQLGKRLRAMLTSGTDDIVIGSECPVPGEETVVRAGSMAHACPLPHEADEMGRCKA